MTDINNEPDKYQNLEDKYFKKLSAYVQLEKTFVEQSSAYIHNINTSAKNGNYYDQNVFVDSTDLANVASSFFNCKEVDLNQWENSNIPSELVSYDTCKGYAVNHNKPFFGVQNLDGVKSCYVKHDNAEASYVNSVNNKYNNVSYWKSKQGNANANVLVLGFDATISLMSYLGDEWWKKDNIQNVYWSSGKKIDGCDQIWGGAITDLKAVYGKKCKNRSEWTEENGITNITKVLSDKLLHTQGANLLINDKLIGGAKYDPCKSQLKELDVSYKCGENANLQELHTTENSYANIVCPETDCLSYFGNTEVEPFILRLTDEGDLCIFRSKDDSSVILWKMSSVSKKVSNALNIEKVAGKYKSGWANDNGFQVHPKKKIINDDKYNNVDWLQGRDYIKSGEPFQTGMLLASASGNCCMVLNDDGYLYLYYTEDLCTSKKEGYFGKIMNVLGISKIDTNRPDSLSNIGKIGYVVGHGPDKGKVKPYLDSHIRLSNDYSEIDKNTMFYGKSIVSQKFSNVNLQDCKTKCSNGNDACMGITWVDSNASKIGDGSEDMFESGSRNGDCYIQGAPTYPGLLRNKISAKGRHTLYKKPTVTNNRSCNDTDINSIDNSKWESYDSNNLISTHISPKFLCGLAAITKELKVKLDVAYKELDDVVKEVSAELNQLTKNEDTLDGEKKKLIKNMKGYVDKFDSIHKKHNMDNNGIAKYQQQQMDTKKQYLSADTKYIYGGILIVILIILLVKLIK